MKTVVVIPTYNEKDNVRPMVESLLAVDGSLEILFVDDNSPDGTGDVIESAVKDDSRVHCLHREKKEGLAKAYLAGFKKAIELGADKIVQMDCDFSHNPEDVPRLVSEDADLVIGSRYVKGGATPGWPFKRRLVSRAGGVFIRTVTGIPLKDPTGGFKCWKVSALKAMRYEAIESAGYSFQLEMNHRAWKSGLKIKELPIVFTDRVRGSSKISAGIAVESVKIALRLRWMSMFRDKEMYKWTLLGALWLTYLFLQGTRQIFGATVSQIKADFASAGVSDVQIGAVSTVFGIVMGVCLPFSGIAADFLRRKWIVITGVVLFSFGTFLSSFASGIGLFILSYGIITSSCQAFVGASATSLISQYHIETRATAFSIYQSALYLGIISFSAISGYLGGMKDMGSGAWRLPFRIFGLAGLAIAVFLVFVLNDKHPSGAPRGPVKKRSFKEAATILFRRPSALLTALSLLMFIAVDGSYRHWMPNLLGDKFEGAVDPKWVPLNALAWHFAGAFVGVAAGSRISDRLAKFRPGIRLETMFVGMLAAVPFILLMAFASNFAVCCIAMALFGVFRGVYDSNLFAALFEVIPQRYHAAGAAIAFSVSFLLGSFSSMVTGWMNDNLTVRFSIAAFAGFYIVGALMLIVARVFFFNRDYERMKE